MSRVLIVMAALTLVAAGSLAHAGTGISPQDSVNAVQSAEVSYAVVYVHFVDAWGNEYVMGPYYSLYLAARVRNNLQAMGYSAWLST